MTHTDNPDRIAIARAMSEGGAQDMNSSPLLTALSCQIEAAQVGGIRLRFHPSAEHVQGAGMVAGGITATMLDFALAFAGLTTCKAGESAASIGLSVQFLKPVTPTELRVEAQLVSSGYRVAQAQAQLLDLDGAVLATAQSPLAMKRNPS